jgi:hypothetical protein
METQYFNGISPGMFLVKHLAATTPQDKKACLALEKECPEEVRRIAAAEGIALKA